MGLKPFYGSTFFRSIANGLINPFIPVFALALGASKTIIGLTTTLPNISKLFSQLLWGSLSEVTKKKKILVIVGGVLWAILWLPVALVKDPVQLIILLTIQSFLASMSIPSWTVLLIRSTPKYKRGEINGRVNTISGIGTFIGTMVAGFVLNRFGFVWFLFIVICLLGILSRVAFSFLKEPHIPIRTKKFTKVLESTLSLSVIKKERKLKSLLLAIMFLNFSVGIPAPFFSIYILKIGGTNIDIAIISSLATISAIIFYRAWGTLIDFLGRKTVMLSCIIPISIYPLVYAVANNVFWLYLYAIINGMSWAGFNLATFVYLSDVLPTEKGPSSVSLYNLFTGLSSSIAPFVGGLIAEFTSLRFIFILSMILRFSSFTLLDRLEEKVGFKPRGIFRFGPEFFGLSYKIEMFVSTYSLLIDEARKKGRVLFDFKNIRKFVEKLKT